MTDETVAQEEQPEVETTVIAQPDNAEPDGNENEQGGEQEAAREKPEGWDQVDLSELPDHLRSPYEKRIHRLYGQVKRSESMMREMAENQRRLYERLENWESGQVQQRTSQRVSELEREYKDAFASGDGDRAWAIQRELAELYSGQTQQPARKAEPEPKPQDKGLPEWEAATIAEWAKDRPFAQDKSPDQEWVAKELNALYADPQWAQRPVEDKLDEIDRRYTQKSRPKGQQVLDGQGASRGAGRGPKLSEDEKGVARMLFPNLPAKDAYAKYAAGKGKV